MRLESLERLGWRFGLETVRTLLSELGNPEQSLSVIHVAGSNGKGSTCAFIASFLKHCGYRTGLYTSPHLCDLRERFRINGSWISQEALERHSQGVLKACRKVQAIIGHSPTHFEALTAMAFCWFKEQKVDWVVLEVGLGGRLDATNVVRTPAVSLIAPVGLEHQDILGKTIEKIAWEKAGILKAGCPAAAVQTHPRAARVMDQTARQRGTQLWLAGRDFHFRKERSGFYWEGPGLRYHFKLPGLAGYQVPNAALALAGIQALQAKGVRAEAGTIQTAFLSTRWPGRMEEINRKPLQVLDGAHNPDAAKALVASLKARYPRKRWIVLNGYLGDKDHEAVVRTLAPLASHSIVTEPDSDRKKDGEFVFKAWEQQGVPSLLVKDWGRALDFALLKQSAGPPGTGLLITGSLYLVGACRSRLMGLKGLEKI